MKNTIDLLKQLALLSLNRPGKLSSSDVPRDARRNANVARHNAMKGIAALMFFFLISLSTAMAQDIEVDASISGYNLIWPSTRCCSFELHINAVGVAAVFAETNSDGHPEKFAKKTQLTTAQLADLRRAIADSDFFNLPSDICCFAVDGDERRIKITDGKRSHSILIGQSGPINESHALQLQRQHADLIWSALRSIAEIPGYNVEHNPTNNARKDDVAKPTRH